MNASLPPIAQIKNSMRAAWMAGDFGVIARRNERAAEEFVEGLRIEPGIHALDVACGTGNTAIPLARKGARVTGVDIATNLLAQARERAAAEGLDAVFQEGDAEQLPYEDGGFDLALSMFGAMFAPRPELVAAELGRVVKKGGLVAMANWNPGSFTATQFRVTGRHVSPPPGVAPSVLWGDAAVVRERLAPFFEDIETEIVPMAFDLPMSPAGVVQMFRTYFGPMQIAFGSLDEAGQRALEADLVALWSEANSAPDPDSHTLIANEFLKVTGRRK